MENEYSHLEQLVNDVTNLDTARMTLRWALERLHALEKSNAELKRDSAAAQAAREQAEQKVRSVGQSMESRSKALDEQEGFHKKMEATLDLLSGGKIDVTHLVRKEAQLDQHRRELEEDYQRRFENLDKTQAQIAQRWNQRLLNVESRYAERLSESQTHYDGLRQGLEKEYQARLARLEESFRSREKELLERVNGLEESAKLHDNAVEEKRVALETEVSAKKTELEHNYQKLKTALETNFDVRVRTMEDEHAKRMKSLEAAWEAERNRILEEQHARENRFRAAQDRIKELENSVEKKLAQLEADFSGRKAKLDARYQKSRQEMSREVKDKMAVQEKAWKCEKSRLEAGFSMARKDFEAAQTELAETAVKIKEVKKGLIDKDSAHHVEILELNRRHEQAMQERMSEMTRRDAAWAEKLRKIEHDVIWKKVAELDSKYQEREAEFRSKEDEIRAGYEEMLHKRVVEHEAEGKALREGFDKERRQLKEGIAAREATILEVSTEADRVAQEAIKETSGFKTKLGAVRKDMESEFRDRESRLQEELKNREAEMSRMKDESVRRDAEWAGKLRKMEHDVIWKKAAELDSKYQERRIELENRTIAVRAQAESEVKKFKDEFKVNLAARRAELENEYAARVSGLEANYGKGRENSEQEYKNKINTLADEYARRKKLYEESWQAERDRFESEIADSRKAFVSTQAELAVTVTRIQKLEKNLVEKDADHDRQILELKRRHESVSRDRIRKEVDANVTGLNKDLEMMTIRMEELGGIVREKENMINGLKNEISTRNNEWSEKLRNFEHDIISEKVRKLEEEYHKHRMELEIQVQKERAQMKKDLEKLRKK